MTDEQMRTALSTAELHIRHKGPVAFGGYFFGITGFHGFHVFSGVIINIVMLIMTQKNVFQNKGHYLMIEKAGPSVGIGMMSMLIIMLRLKSVSSATMLSLI